MYGTLDSTDADGARSSNMVNKIMCVILVLSCVYLVISMIRDEFLLRIDEQEGRAEIWASMREEHMLRRGGRPEMEIEREINQFLRENENQPLGARH